MNIVCIILCLIFIACIIKLLNDNNKASKIIEELRIERSKEIVKQVESDNKIFELEKENKKLLKQIKDFEKNEKDVEKLQEQVEVEKPKRTRKTTTTKKSTTKKQQRKKEINNESCSN